MTTPIIAAAYVRCSTRKQERKNQSLPAQRRDITQRAIRDNATIVRWFEDGGISGRSTEARTGLLDLLEWVKRTPEVQRVYVYDFKRMARNREDAIAIRRAMRKAGVKLVALVQPTTDDPIANVLLEAVYDATAEIDSLLLGRVVRRGQQQSLRNGLWPYRSPPFGYRIERVRINNTDRFRLAIDPARAPIVRRIFDLYIGGLGFRATAARLTSDGVPPPSRGDRQKLLPGLWQSKHVGRVIARRIYTGVCVIGHDDTEDEVIADHHDAIIDTPTWERAQLLRRARHRRPRETRELNAGSHGLFRPFMRCGRCGGPMKVNRGGQSASGWLRYYCCSRRWHNRSACPGINGRVGKVDRLVLDRLEADVLTDEALRSLVSDTIDRLRNDTSSELDDRRSRHQARIAEITAQLTNLAVAIASGAMTAAEIAPVADSLRRQREQAEIDLALLPASKPLADADTIDLAAFRDSIRAAWHAKPLSDRRRAPDQLIESVTLNEGELHIRYAWKSGPRTYTHQSPSGPSDGGLAALFCTAS